MGKGSWALCVGAASAAVLACLHQRTLYGDAPSLLEAIRTDAIHLDSHAAWWLIAAGLHRALAAWNVSPYAIGIALSAVGVGIGTAALYLAARRLQRSHGEALLACLGVLSAPPVVFFGTTVELHGLFFAWVGFTALAWATAFERGSRATEWLVGASTGASYFFHATGHLLAASAALMLVMTPRWAGDRAGGGGRWRVRLRSGARVLLGHLALVVAIHQGLRLIGRPIDAAAGWHYLRECASVHVNHPRLLPRVVWNEWICAFAPWSLLCWWGWRRSATRRLTTALALCLVGYLALSFLLIATLDERGAYLLPLAVPAVAISLHALPRWLVLVSIALGCAISTARIAAFDRSPRQLEFELGFRACVGEHAAVLLVGNGLDLETCLVRMPEVPVVAVGPIAATPNAQAEAAAEVACAWIRTRVEARQHVVLTEDAVVLLLEGRRHGLRVGDALLQRLRASFVLTPLAAGEFSGYRLDAE